MSDLIPEVNPSLAERLLSPPDRPPMREDFLARHCGPDCGYCCGTGA